MMEIVVEHRKMIEQGDIEIVLMKYWGIFVVIT